MPENESVVEEIPVVEETPKVEEQVPPIVEAPKPLLRRVIQPKDEQGNSIGSPHVYTGVSEQELMDKMADAIANGTLKIRQLTRAEKMKPVEAKPADEPKPRELTADERFQIAEKIKNPETVLEAYRDLYKAEFGLTPQEAAEKRENSARQGRIADTRAAAIAFMESHPEYYSTKKNGVDMGEYMAAKGWDTTSIKSYEDAFKDLSSDGLLETEPEPEPEPEPPAPEKEPEPTVTEAPPRTEAPAARGKTAFPSSLSRDQASGTGRVKSKEPSAAEIAMMNADQLQSYYRGKGMWGK